MKVPVTNHKYRINCEYSKDSNISNGISNSNIDYTHFKDTTLRQT